MVQQDETTFQIIEDSILLPIGTDLNDQALLIPFSSNNIQTIKIKERETSPVK